MSLLSMVIFRKEQNENAMLLTFLTLEGRVISAKERQNIDELREVLYKRVRELHVQKYPYNDFLYDMTEN